MAPDPKQRLPRELLIELIEEGSEAFREVLEKLFNAASVKITSRHHIFIRTRTRA